ncbi:MAG: head-tail connector protein [Henriciella sp.]|nr:head-tail connector protein [Henriciella sp.]
MTPPPAALMTEAEARRQCVIDDDSEDDILAGLIATATGYLEAEHGILGRALITQTWRVRFPCVPAEAVVELPYPPIKSIEAVKYIDTDGVEQTFAPENYGMHASRSKSFVALNPSASWPVAAGHWPFSIEFVAGYGDEATDVPDGIVHAAKLLVSHFYENREATTDLPLRDLPLGVQMLLAPFRVAESVIA